LKILILTAVSTLKKSILKNEVRKMVKNCLEEMSLLYREPLSLYYLEEKSYKEISDILRIPIGTVGTRINRAKLIMRQICQRKKIKLKLRRKGKCPRLKLGRLV